MNAHRSILVAAIATLVLLGICASQVRADVMTPAPRTAWKKDQSPSESKVIVAGLALSAAIVAMGLLFAGCSFSKSRVTAIATVALACTAVAGVFLGVRHYLGLIEEDREKWAQWELTESKRPRGGPTPEDIRSSGVGAEQDKNAAEMNEKPPLAEDR